MSQTSKAVLGIIAVIVVAGTVWWYVSGTPGTPAPTETAHPPAAVPSPSSSTGSKNAGSQPNVSVQSNSNAALNQDLSSFDNQVSAFSSDSATIDQGLNDTPVPQN